MAIYEMSHDPADVNTIVVTYSTYIDGDGSGSESQPTNINVHSVKEAYFYFVKEGGKMTIDEFRKKATIVLKNGRTSIYFNTRKKQNIQVL
jgi:hypothetical protein